jgi:dTDP-4-amino-4,6-dideoxygalactose transaminase
MQSAWLQAHSHHPSSFPRVPLAVPYWNAATYRGIFRSLMSGRVIDGPDLSKLRSLVVEMLDVKGALLCGSGSFAIEIALQACGVRPGDEVVISTFCCSAVVAPILAIGALPVLADIGDELNITAETIEPVLNNTTKAVIVPHLFGNPADITSIIDLARGRNICVIDDAAQALGGTIDGQPVGSFGDAGILSFGSEKVCFGLGGGAVVSRKKEILDRCSKTDLAPPQLSIAVREFLSTMFWRRWRRWTLPVQASLFRIKRTTPDSPPNPYRKQTMPNLNAAVASSLLQTLRENIAARRARVHAYQNLLATGNRLALIPHRTGSACLTQVVQVLPRRGDDDLATYLIETLGRAGYEVQGSYVPIHLIPYYQQWARGGLPHAERVWADSIELPCEPEVSFDDVERIAAIIKQVVNS